MNRKAKYGIGLITVFIGLLSLPTIANARDYPMVCRVGGDMRLLLTPNVTGQTRFELRFRKSRQSYNANRESIARGECTWLDRAINYREPTLMAWSLDARAATSFRTVESGHAQTYIVSDRGADIDTATHFLRVIRGSTFDGGRVRYHEFFEVNVHNTNAGYFQISSIRPF